MSTEEAPGISAMVAATRPAVQDSAQPTVTPARAHRSTSSRAIASASVAMRPIPYEKMTERPFQKYWTPETTVSTTAAIMSAPEMSRSHAAACAKPSEDAAKATK